MDKVAKTFLALERKIHIQISNLAQITFLFLIKSKN